MLRRAALVACLALTGATGCPPPNTPEATRPAKAQKWLTRAQEEFAAAQIDASHDSVQHALDIVPDDPDVRLLGARIALARLEYDEVVRLLEGVEGSEARSLRGRAYWYKGEIEHTARELDRLLDDPDVDDPWAKAISKLAHRGEGRKPFDITTTDGRLESVQMAKVAGAPLFVVPLEIDGDQALALVSTGTSEVMLDSATRGEPSWVSLRFGQRLEVRDVPALTQDLTQYSMKLGVPIKALLGSHLLRELNATLDWHGRQFVARSFVPPPPPVASRVDVHYLRGGGMVLGSSLSRSLGGGEGGDAPSVPSSLLVDTSMGYSVALDSGGWEKIGIEPSKLPMVPDVQDGELRSGAIPLLQLGTFKLPQIPGVYGTPIETFEKQLRINVDGVMGAGLLSEFRLTFSDGGRVLWVEQRPKLGEEALPPTPPGGAPGGPGGVPGGPQEGIGPRPGSAQDSLLPGSLLQGGPEGGLTPPAPPPGEGQP
ncbi:MAG: hypothetical protein R3B72_44110 [Polyangiaceae bacterium]